MDYFDGSLPTTAFWSSRWSPGMNGTKYAHRVRSGAQARACIDGLPSDVRGSGGVRRAPSYVVMEEGVSGWGEEPR